MARESRIRHPPGELFVCGHRWVAKQEGLAVALVLGALDFLDRAREQPGEPVATRARIQVELDGFLGRDAIDKALRRLVELTWIRRHERCEVGRANLVRVVEFSLVGNSVIPGVRNSGRREYGVQDGNPDGSPSSVYTKEKEPNIPPPPVSELFEAALWEASSGGKLIGEGWKRTVLPRLENSHDEDDVKTWARWKRHHEQIAERNAQLTVARQAPRLDLEAKAAGDKFLAKSAASYARKKAE